MAEDRAVSEETEVERPRDARTSQIYLAELRLIREALAEQGQLLAVIHAMVARHSDELGKLSERLRNIDVHIELIEGTLRISEAATG